MAPSQPDSIRYLSAADVTAAMPPLQERLRLAERTMTALVADAQLPPKIGVHPRPPGSFAHAMPAHLRGADPAGSDDLLGMKWVAGYQTNRALGLPAIHGLVIVTDPATGQPAAILDAGPITAERTAAVSGVAIARYAPAVARRRPVVAILGAGVQGRSHLPVVGHTVRGAELVIFDRHPERAAALVEAAERTPGISAARTAPTARDATRPADLVITAASFGPPEERQPMNADWLTPEALVVAVDYATYVSASLARSASLFLVDERGQFLANRDAGSFDGYPDPAATLGEAILDDTPRPPGGHVVVSHLGVGLADIIFAAEIVRRASGQGLGTLLPR
jgi:ornithine cyclodeaminase/alanine dehydrogenase-like protein (mu-crystallin family)